MSSTQGKKEMGPKELEEALHNTRQLLLRLRSPKGHWEGDLSSSALSTAVGVVALEHYHQSQPPGLEESVRGRLEDLVKKGRAWLAQTQNGDGGWGDTTLSLSNISTTALGWAAFAGAESDYPETVRRCSAWLEKAAGRVEPQALAQAIAQRYGKDRTFSVPILATLALTGRLGPPDHAWQVVSQLPFELAACPRRWFAWLRLPVVSYALPALIALGLVRHHQRPTKNPVFLLVRNLVRQPVLRVLQSIQPSSGGFLEATPLTSFVVLSLVGAGLPNHPVTRAGIEFLIRSGRPDGSWPIDTNLATWVTTLSVNALAARGPLVDFLPVEDQDKTRAWLLGQQYCAEHPYTLAPPGGWAWTDLSGGVSDADDTPGALLALRHLRASSGTRQAVLAGVTWLLDLQNADGGMPTFCRGWGALPFDRSSADLTSHAIRAWLAWSDSAPPPVQKRIQQAVARALRFLQRTQRADGAWAPLWFGNQHGRAEENLAYGTSRVLLALAPLKTPEVAAATVWLLRAQNADGGWGGMAETPSTVEETALVLEALAAVWEAHVGETVDADLQNALRSGLNWLLQATRGGTFFPPSPIGFYFAKLWYYEKLYPVIFTLAALGRLARLADRLWENSSETVFTR
jgi:squalene-hopene/tetraprenyl-beta-curcumene cyclase